ncbi:MAG: hypothetical protein RL171_2043 [Pseudomonadota bacterium]|jgi:hypothetical protein
MNNTELWLKIAKDLERRNTAIAGARAGDAVAGWSASLAVVGQVGIINVASDIATYRGHFYKYRSICYGLLV